MKIQNTIILFILLISSCIKPEDYPLEPVITAVSVDKTVIQEGTGDFITLTFDFTDGDGNLGDNTGNQDMTNMRVFDTRIETIDPGIPFTIPEIPTQGAGNGVSGEINVKLSTTFCLSLSGPNRDSEELTYKFWIEDRDGNRSNTAETEVITIICE